MTNWMSKRRPEILAYGFNLTSFGVSGNLFEILVEDALKLKFLKGSARPFFCIVEQQVFQVIQVQCVRLGVLLLACCALKC